MVVAAFKTGLRVIDVARRLDAEAVSASDRSWSVAVAVAVAVAGEEVAEAVRAFCSQTVSMPRQAMHVTSLTYPPSPSTVDSTARWPALHQRSPLHWHYH